MSFQFMSIRRPMFNKFTQQKNATKTFTCHTVSIKQSTCQSCLFKLGHFDAQCLRGLHKKQQENEQVPPALSHSNKLLKLKNCQTEYSS